MTEANYISSVSQYLYHIQKVHEVHNPEIDFDFRQPRLFYRGQADCSWSISSRLMREGMIPYEYDMLRDARNMLWKELTEHKTYLEKISLFQHYGLPTRLLDVTTNPLVALYFACEKEKDKNGVVFYGYIQNDDISHVQRILQYIFEHPYTDFIDNAIKEQDLEKYSYTYYVYPTLNNARVSRQQGEFLMAPLIKGIGNDARMILKNYEFNSCFEGRLLISKDSKNSILDELDEYGFNQSTLFQNIESQLMYLSNKYYKNFY